MERATTLIRRLGNLVRALRDELGLTQAQMAARCGLSVKYLGQIERGEVEVSLSTLDSLARGLHMSLAEIFGYVAAAHSAAVRPTLDRGDWQRVLEALEMLIDYVDGVVSLAEPSEAELEATTTPYHVRRRAGRRHPSKHSR